MRVRMLFVIVAIVLALGSQPAAASRSIEPIVDWNKQALDTVRQERLGAFPAARLYAMVNAAMYDAVNGIDVARRGAKRRFALVSANGASRWANRRAAAAAAAHAVLSALHPDLSNDYDAQLDAHLSALRGRQRFIEAGRQWGEQVGHEVVAMREDDGSSPSLTQPGGTESGEYRADWNSAQFADMAPFAINDPLDYLSDGPPALDSAAYADAFNEVKSLGNDANADAEKNEIARFWRAGGGSVRPPGEWIKIALTVAPKMPSTRASLSQRARLFALLGMALGDSAATSANSKFVYHFWRPATAIQNADTDGNPNTAPDSDWTPRNSSIGSSPEHTSGQSTFAAAGATVLAGFYCRDRVRFSFTGDNAIAGARTFKRFSDAAREAGRARIFAGIHFEFSNQAGQSAGRSVAREILDSALLRTRGRTHRGACPR